MKLHLKNVHLNEHGLGSTIPTKQPRLESYFTRPVTTSLSQCFPHIHLFVAARHNIKIVRDKKIFYLQSWASCSITQTAAVNNITLNTPKQWMAMWLLVYQ